MMMSVSLLVGCGGSNDNANQGNDSNANQQGEVVEKEDKEEEPTPDVIDLSGQVILDNEIAKVTVNKLEAYSGTTKRKYDANLYVTVENKSEYDKLFIDYARINNKEVHAVWRFEDETGGNAMEIASGETKEAIVELWDNEIRELEQKITDVVLAFESGESMDIAFASEHFYPYGEDAVVAYQRPLDEDDVVVMENDSVRVILTETTKDEEVINIAYYFENKTDKAIYPLIASEQVGGVEWDFYQNDSDEIPENAVAQLEISVLKDELSYVEGNLDYDTLSEISYTLWILDASTFTEDTYDDIRGWEKYGETKFNPEVYSLGNVQENYNPQNFQSLEEE